MPFTTTSSLPSRGFIRGRRIQREGSFELVSNASEMDLLLGEEANAKFGRSDNLNMAEHQDDTEVNAGNGADSLDDFVVNASLSDEDLQQPIEHPAIYTDEKPASKIVLEEADTEEDYNSDGGYTMSEASSEASDSWQWTDDDLVATYDCLDPASGWAFSTPSSTPCHEEEEEEGKQEPLEPLRTKMPTVLVKGPDGCRCQKGCYCCGCLEVVKHRGVLVAVRPPQIPGSLSPLLASVRIRPAGGLGEIALLIDKTVADIAPFAKLSHALKRRGRNVFIILPNSALAQALKEQELDKDITVLSSSNPKEALAACRPSMIIHPHQHSAHRASDVAITYERCNAVPAVMLGFDVAFASMCFPPRPSLRVRSRGEARVAAEVVDKFLLHYVESGLWAALQSCADPRAAVRPAPLQMKEE
mmetsp:Transcript_102100/g.218626  ORF Transcript_102100/g.218626 Transcript_102100/m.218626 type:complete len:416 (+) Transcript_102100:128-1375(+)